MSRSHSTYHDDDVCVILTSTNIVSKVLQRNNVAGFLSIKAFSKNLSTAIDKVSQDVPYSLMSAYNVRNHQ